MYNCKKLDYSILGNIAGPEVFYKKYDLINI